MPRQPRSRRSFAVQLFAGAGSSSWCYSPPARTPSRPTTRFSPTDRPFPCLVDNENYLDVNVSVVTGGVPRRLGDVPGNSQRQVHAVGDVAYSEPIYLTATTIGGRDSYSSSTLNVGYGQVIELHLGVNLRQSVAFLRDSL